MKPYSAYQNATLFILRLITAAIFYGAAIPKLSFWSSAPEGISPFLLFMTRLLSIAEPLGATAILLGFLTRLASGGLAIVMIGAIYVIQFVYGMNFVMPKSPGWNFPLEVFGACLLLTAFGAGKWSIDYVRQRRYFGT